MHDLVQLLATDAPDTTALPDAGDSLLKYLIGAVVVVVGAVLGYLQNRKTRKVEPEGSAFQKMLIERERTADTLDDWKDAVIDALKLDISNRDRALIQAGLPIPEPTPRPLRPTRKTDSK